MESSRFFLKRGLPRGLKPFFHHYSTVTYGDCRSGPDLLELFEEETFERVTFLKANGIFYKTLLPRSRRKAEKPTTQILEIGSTNSKALTRFLAKNFVHADSIIGL